MKLSSFFVLLILVLGFSEKTYSQDTNSVSARALKKYLYQHVRYPKEAIEEGISIRIFMSFVVNSDSTISDVRKLRDLPPFGDEVVKALNTYKNKLNLKADTYTFSVDFMMDDNPSPVVDPKKILKKYLFDLQVIGYGVIHRTYIIQ